jgi:hypothetical protein
MVFILLYRTSSLIRLCRRLRQVARPLSNSDVTFGKPSWWLRRRRIDVGGPLVVTLRRCFRQVARPSSSLCCRAR